MRFPITKRVCIAGAIAFACLSSQAGKVRLSFLGDDAALQDTLKLLADNGCTEQATLVFKQAVQRYFINEFDFDLSKFPKLQNGFYSFATPQKLVAALPDSLFATRHQFDFNCFDTVLVLADGQLRTSLHPDEISGPFLVTSMSTNGQVLISTTKTPWQAFAQGYESGYREYSERVIPKSMHDARICLTADLFRCHILPLSTTQETLKTNAITVLRAAWHRDGLRFSKRFELVLCHGVTLPQHTLCTSHAGLLFRRGSGYTYIEKDGGRGPFVRLDLEDRIDLLPWLAALFYRSSDTYFVTFNDAEIEKFEPKK